MEWDVPDTAGERGVLRVPGPDGRRRARSQGQAGDGQRVRVARGGAGRDRPVRCPKGSGEQSLARTLYPRLEEDWLLIADRNFYNWEDWCAAADTGAALLWRVKADLRLPVLELLPDGSYRSVLVKTRSHGRRPDGLIEAARRGEDLDPALARHVRVVEYEVPDRDGDRTS